MQSDILRVVFVAMRKRKEAIDATDAIGQARAEASLNALRPNWLSTDWVLWSGRGYPLT